MWCEKCRTDVAGVATHDLSGLRCVTCGSDLPMLRPAGAGTPRDPRELLARWAREEAEATLPAAPAAAQPAVSKPAYTSPPRPRPLDVPEESPVSTIPRSPILTPPPARQPARTPFADAVAATVASPPAPRAPEPATARAVPTPAASLETRKPAESRIPPGPADAVQMKVRSTLPTLPRETEPVSRTSAPFPVESNAPVDVPAGANVGLGLGGFFAWVGALGLSGGMGYGWWSHWHHQNAQMPIAGCIAIAGQCLMLWGMVSLISRGLNQATRTLNSQIAHMHARMSNLEARLTHQADRNQTTRTEDLSDVAA